LAKDPNLTWFRREMMTRPLFFHLTIAAGFIVFSYPYVTYLTEKFFPDKQDFRSVLTPLRMIGGLEEQDFYIVERAKAIERAKARAA